VSDQIAVGDVIARLLEGSGAACAFGVISIHNMPILDAIGRRGMLRFVPARGEAGAANMADAYARVADRLGVAITSTGTGAGNAAGTLLEARSAGTPLLHLTGQIESAYLDRDAGYIHEAPDQLGMLRAISKAAYRVRTAPSALGTVREAIRVALAAPQGPVSVEIPIDVQKTLVPVPDAAAFAAPAIERAAPDPAAVAAVVRVAAGARRPLLWLGRGARDAGGPARRLARMGWAIVSSVAGRGIVPETDRASLASFGAAASVEALLAGCDLLVVAGSRLRSNETLGYRLPLPQPRVLIDVDELARDRAYAYDHFIHADCELALDALASALEGTMTIDPRFGDDVRAARSAADAGLRTSLGPFADVAAALECSFAPDDVWVRDVTISNSTWGNRLPAFHNSRQGVHALGGGIGQGLPMAIGAAIAAPGRRIYALVGDGGLALSLGELGTLAQERLPVTLIVMNDGGYGVIRNIQDHEYGGRRYFADLSTPNYVTVAQAAGIEARHVAGAERFAEALAWSRERERPVLLDVDMAAVGSFAQTFAGPPVRDTAGGR
jgi:acetolactate synthase I/II/III large subunit